MKSVFVKRVFDQQSLTALARLFTSVCNTMKCFPVILFAFSLLSSTQLVAQSNPSQDIGQALRRGDASAIAQYMDQTVLLELLDRESLFSKSDAMRKLSQFLQENKFTAFKQSHNGNSSGKDAYYVIGELASSAGKYRLYLYFNTKSGQSYLQELRITQ